MIPFMWGVPLLFCFIATGALVVSIEETSDGKYFNGIAFAGVFLLCCWVVYTVLKRRARNRSSRW
ncbi:MAG TPA: hypothetical protein VG816_15130 [Solirubrobacterales bacterium]|nr:hypothetical protein [Solirubrobacterales bacterium]